jgi:hypothetical protein
MRIVRLSDGFGKSGTAGLYSLVLFSFIAWHRWLYT